MVDPIRERSPDLVFLFILLMSVAFTATAGSVTQTDWTGGPAGIVVEADFGTTFARSENISWLAVPGQIALSAVPRSSPSVTRLMNGSFGGAESVHAADIDGDGRIDVVAAAYSGDVSWWRNDGGDPTGWSHHVIDDDFAGANQIFATDVDGDGDKDVLGAAYLANEVSWWQNNGGSPIQWTRHVIDSAFGGACSVRAADLDGDGDTDLLSTAYDANTIAWWENDGRSEPGWLRHVLSDVFGGAHEVWAEDLDLDGDNDVIGVAWDGDNVVWWRNDGGSPLSWSRLLIDRDFEGASSIDAADVDGDGDFDLVGVARHADQVAWWRNDGGTPIRWTKHEIAQRQAGAWSVFSADVDGDGFNDVLAAVWFRDELTWFRNNGDTPVTWERHVVDPSLGGASAVFAADIDDDGALELLGAGFDEADIVVWEATQFRQAGWIESTIVDTESGFWGGTCDWSAIQPDRTALAVEGRTLDAPEDDEPWVPLQPGERDATLGQRRFLQLRVRMSTADPDVSPILEGVECRWLDELIRRPRGRTRP